MASVDVPVALLGYGTVGAAVNRLLDESADDIERATGHRLRVVKALVRDLGKERELPRRGAACSRPTSPRSLDDPSIAVVAEVMGGVEPTGELRPRAARARQARRHREQAARRAARRRALRRRVGGGRAAALRGERLRGDPGDQGAARVARRHERPPRARDRQRHDELHAHRDGGGQDLRRGARRGAGSAASPRPTRPTTSPAPTPRRRWRSSRRSRSTRASSSTDVEYVGHRRRSTPLDVAAARELDMVIRLVGAARLVDGQRRRARPARVRRPAASARRGRRRVQRGDAAGRRDPRDHARGPGRRRRRDRLGRDRRHGERDRDDGHRASCRTTPRGASCRGCPPGEQPLAVLLPPLGRRPPGRARARRRGARRARRSRSRACCSTRTATAPRCTSSRTRRASGALDEALAAIARAATRCARELAAAPRRLRPRRRGARMGVTAAPSVGLTLGEGSTPLVPRRAPARSGSALELYLKCEGVEPDRQLQGPRHGRRRRERAVERRCARGRLRVDRQHRRVGRRVRGARRPDGGRPHAGRCDRRGRSSRRRALPARGCSRCAAASTTRCGSAASSPSAEGYVLVNSLNPHRIEGQKTAVVGDRRAARRGARRARAALRRRRQHRRRTRRASRRRASTPRLVVGAGRRARDDARLRDPDRRAGARRDEVERSSPTGRVEVVSLAEEEITRPPGSSSRARRASSASRRRPPASRRSRA